MHHPQAYEGIVEHTPGDVPDGAPGVVPGEARSDASGDAPGDAQAQEGVMVHLGKKMHRMSRITRHGPLPGGSTSRRVWSRLGYAGEADLCLQCVHMCYACGSLCAKCLLGNPTSVVLNCCTGLVTWVMRLPGDMSDAVSR